jgi:rod shape determining protein RodA
MKLPLAWRRLDLVLFGLVVALAVCGLVLVYSAVNQNPSLGHLVLKQAGWVGLGLLALSFFYIIDYQGLVNLAYPLYAVLLALLVLVLAIGITSRGSSRWFDLGVFHLQPSEFGKLVVILALAKWLSENARALVTLRGLAVPLGLAAVPMALIVRQPDLGSAMVLLPVVLVMLYAAGARLWHLAALFISMLATTPLVWFLLKDYQRRRLLTFLDPEADTLGAGYNLIQSKIAIGSGGWFGRGFMQGSQSQLRFIPMHHNDFIFSVLGEEWGLAGASLVLALYLLLVLQALKIAGSARDRAGSLLCVGIATLLATQVVINVGMTTGVLPVTGIPLPLLSYGGSSVISVMVCAGILLNVRRESRVQ